MPKAHEVAAELRKLAYCFDQMDQELDMPYAFLHFSHTDKQPFKSMAQHFPRPFTKDIQFEGKDFSEIRLKYTSAAMNLWCNIPQNLTCTLVTPAQPAVYECDPILSPEEDAALDA